MTALNVSASNPRPLNKEESTYEDIFTMIKDTFKPSAQKEGGASKNDLGDSDSDDEETNLFTKQIQKLKHKPKLHKSKKKEINPLKDRKSILRSK